MAHLQGMDPQTKRDRVVRVAQIEGKGRFFACRSSAALTWP